MTASTTSPRPTTPPTTPAINTMFGPEEDSDFLSSSASTSVSSVEVDSAVVPVRVDVAKVVDGRDDCREASVVEAVGARMGDEGLVDFGVSAGAVVGDGSTEAVGGGAVDVEIADGDVDESVELDGAELDEEEEATDVTAVGPATGTGSAGAAEISKGGLYSKVLVKSSIIFRPYLSPGGKLLVPWTVPGMVHVKVPVFSTDALYLRISVSSVFIFVSI